MPAAALRPCQHVCNIQTLKRAGDQSASDSSVRGVASRFAGTPNELVSNRTGCEWNSLADALGRRTVFNIHGNHYRLVARVNYKTQRVFILHILTHSLYSKGGWKR